jgi:hypothetical protein
MDRIIKTCKLSKILNERNSVNKQPEVISYPQNSSSSEQVKDLTRENMSTTEIIEKNQAETPPKKLENTVLKEKYKLALEKYEKECTSRKFQVYNVFKTKIKRMYRVDCMTRKLNV